MTTATPARRRAPHVPFLARLLARLRLALFPVQPLRPALPSLRLPDPSASPFARPPVRFPDPSARPFAPLSASRLVSPLRRLHSQPRQRLRLRLQPINDRLTEHRQNELENQDIEQRPGDEKTVVRAFRQVESALRSALLVSGLSNALCRPFSVCNRDCRRLRWTRYRAAVKLLRPTSSFMPVLFSEF